jgi:hypothetical protein
MKLREQLLQLRNNSDNSHNRFVNMLCNGVIDSIKSINPDLELVPLARSSARGRISIVLKGEAVVSEGDTTSADVDALLNRIKNEKELLNRIKD